MPIDIDDPNPQAPAPPPRLTVWQMSGMGTELVGALIGMTLLGWLMDYWLGTGPWFLIAGAVFGFFGGGAAFLRKAYQIIRTTPEIQIEHPQAPAGEPDAWKEADDTESESWDRTWEEWEEHEKKEGSDDA